MNKQHLEDKDPLLFEAVKYVIDNDNASASFLQRKMSIGYARAAYLLDQMQYLGIIGHADGAKPRRILIKNIEQAEALSQPKPLTTEEMQRKIYELENKVNKILQAFSDLTETTATPIKVVVKYDEDVLDEAEKYAKELGKLPTASQLQRKFNIGYARSARILDELRRVGKK